MIVRRFVPALLLLASACSAPSGDGAAVTGDEDRQLNGAAAMLDANSVDVDPDRDPESGDRPATEE